MKKILFLLFAAIIFASCSNVSEDVTPIDNKTYKVTFNVSNSEMDSKPLKAESLGTGLYYTIYEKESGKAIKFRSRYRNESAQVVEDVPAGSYYIVFIGAWRALTGMHYINPINDTNGSKVDISNFNFYSDFCEGISYIDQPSHKHYGLYYEKVGFTVGVGQEEINEDVVLQPMWSEISVQITDGETCTLPEGTTIVDVVVSPYYYGFNIADGLPKYGGDNSGYGWSFQSLSYRDVDVFREKGLSRKYIMATKGATIKLQFVKYTMDTTELLEERVIYTGDIEGGKRITLKGTLGKTNLTGTFNLSLGELADSGVIPFE